MSNKLMSQWEFAAPKLNVVKMSILYNQVLKKVISGKKLFKLLSVTKLN